MPGPLNIRTLGDMLDADKSLTVCCDRQTPPCSHQADVEIAALIERYSRDLGCDHWSLVRLPWRCSKCGSSAVTFRMLSGKRYEPSFDHLLPKARS